MIGIPLTCWFTCAGSGGTRNLAEYMTSITWSIIDEGGFESCDITTKLDLETAVFFLEQLGGSLTIYSPDDDDCWEGFLNAIDLKVGQETHSLSLDGMANRVRVRYTATYGTPYVTSTASDADSITRYGTKDYVERLGDLTKTAAETMRDAILADRLGPRKRPSSEVRTGDIGGVELTFHFVGHYYKLDWLLTSVSTRTTAVTTTQVTGLITTYNSTNSSTFSTTFTNVVASGLSDTQFIPDDTTYRAAIERLLGLGNASGVRQVWGIFEDRMLTVTLWAGNSPTAPTYRRALGGGIEYVGGGSVPFWNVRPNAMYEISDLLDVVPLTEEADATARYYVHRTVFSADESSMSISLEPTEGNNLTVKLAYLNRRDS